MISVTASPPLPVTVLKIIKSINDISCFVIELRNAVTLYFLVNNLTINAVILVTNMWLNVNFVNELSVACMFLPLVTLAP